MSDIVERLRKGTITQPGNQHPTCDDVDAADALMAEAADELVRLRTALSEAEQRARREALEEAAILAGSVGDDEIRSGSLDLDASVDKIIVAIRALIPSEPHDAEGRETTRRGDPSIFDDAEGRN